MRHPINDWNARAFESRENTRGNRRNTAVFPAEAALFAGLSPEVLHGDILELGGGGGRLVPTLAPKARSYLGTDYAETPLAAARRDYPGVAFQRLDARTADSLGADRFDLVVFAYNGLDYVDHAGRVATLAAVRTILRPGGAFVFSFHNLDYARLSDSLRVRPRPVWREPLEFVWGLRRRAIARKRRAVLKDSAVDGGSYRILNDDGMNHGLLTYYTGLPAQTALLRAAGFTDIAAVALDGSPLDPDRPFTRDYGIHVRAS
jgi:SAM-dependent methyltransferase